MELPKNRLNHNRIQTIMWTCGQNGHSFMTCDKDAPKNGCPWCGRDLRIDFIGLEELPQPTNEKPNEDEPAEMEVLGALFG